MQMMFFMLTHCKLYEKLKLTKLDALGALLAGVCHDLGHDGFTNGYHVNRLTRRAINCNDVAVQESFHASELFRILDDEAHNFLDVLSRDQLKVLRKRVIGMILATDMQRHVADRHHLDNLCQEYGIVQGNNLDKLI